MNKKLTFIIRCILAGIMIYFIYEETGIMTAIFCAMMFVYTEMNNINWKHTSKAFDIIDDYMETNNEIIRKNNQSEPINNLRRVFEKHQVEAGLYEYDEHNAVSSFPDVLNQSIKDYVHCHFDVISEDRFSIEFKIK